MVNPILSKVALSYLAGYTLNGKRVDLQFSVTPGGKIWGVRETPHDHLTKAERVAWNRQAAFMFHPKRKLVASLLGMQPGTSIQCSPRSPYISAECATDGEVFTLYPRSRKRNPTPIPPHIVSRDFLLDVSDLSEIAYQDAAVFVTHAKSRKEYPDE